MSETELPQGRNKFVAGQKIDSIELRATKMAAKRGGSISWNSEPTKSPNPSRRKKQILTTYSDRRIRMRKLPETDREWCEEGELNPYALSGTSPSN